MIPRGLIVAWYGSTPDIPTGWQQCNGTNGTPDLRSLYLRGAGSGVGLGNLGYPNNHNHTYSDDGHRHHIPSGGHLAAGSDYDDDTGDTAVSGTTDSANHLPPAWGLWWIMKL